MKLQLLNPPSATAFLFPDAIGRGRDILIDMQGAERSFEKSLAGAGREISSIRHLLVTHHHADHFRPSDALKLVKNGTQVHFGKRSWASLLELCARKKKADQLLDACKTIRDSGSLHLLGPSGQMQLGDREIAWMTTPHGNGELTCDNLVYRIDDHVVTGDTPLPALFDPGRKNSEQVLDMENGSRVNVLCINVANISRREIFAWPELDARRVRNYLFNHGILEDFLTVLADPKFHNFFSNLKLVVPHHLRRPPLSESMRVVAESLGAASERLGFDFGITFGQ